MGSKPIVFVCANPVPEIYPYAAKEAEVGSDLLRNVEKQVMLRQLDFHWKEHLAAMDYLRQGIHLRGYAQKNPKQEYKREAFDMFSRMLEGIKRDVVSALIRVQVQMPEETYLAQQPQQEEFQFKHEEFSGLDQAALEESGDMAPEREQERQKPFVRPDRKIGRNEPCPCGSGKKYKQCHGKIQ